MSTVRLENPLPHVAVITLDRPERLNAITLELLRDLSAVLDRVESDADCRAVVLTGAGRAFCAGLDLKEAGPLLDLEGPGGVQKGMQIQKPFSALVPRLHALPQPVVAAVNGPAAGGGLALALGADVRVAARSARFLDAFIELGISGCELGLSYLLPRLIGMSRAAELILTGRAIDAEEAERIGLVSRVLDDGDVLKAALEIAERIASHAPFGSRMTKQVLWTNLDAPCLQSAIELESRTQVLGLLTRDFGEQVAARREKRTPRYQDR
jgi:enoyl-CoA hydratase